MTERGIEYPSPSVVPDPADGYILICSPFGKDAPLHTHIGFIGVNGQQDAQAVACIGF